MSGAFQFDVFLSHNQADKPRVRQLAERLRAAGLHVWFEERVIQPADLIARVGQPGTRQTPVRCAI